MASSKKETTMEERLNDLAKQDGVSDTGSQTNQMQEMVERLVQEALAKRSAELDAREAEIKEREKKCAGEPTFEDDTSIVQPVTDNSDAWNEKREIFLPYATKGEEQFVFVAVNGRKYQVPRGKNVTLPLPLYERIKIMQEAESRTVEYRNSLPNEAYPNTTAEAVRVG